MTTQASPGSVNPDGDRRALHFERTYAAAPEEVWSALTEPDRLARWMTGTSVQPGLGGRIVHDFGDDGTCGGAILAWEPPRLLEYEWRFPGETESVVRFELHALAADGTRLVLTHRRLGAEQATGYGAGWHAYLDTLASEVDGLEPVDWGERFAEVLPEYRP
jgi:uncharacterized protein YndB with AHSA1/START domain